MIIEPIFLVVHGFSLLIMIAVTIFSYVFLEQKIEAILFLQFITLIALVYFYEILLNSLKAVV